MFYEHSEVVLGASETKQGLRLPLWRCQPSSLLKPGLSANGAHSPIAFWIHRQNAAPVPLADGAALGLQRPSFTPLRHRDVVGC